MDKIEQQPPMGGRLRRNERKCNEMLMHKSMSMAIYEQRNDTVQCYEAFVTPVRP
jgi:hypothetical protein